MSPEVENAVRAHTHGPTKERAASKENQNAIERIAEKRLIAASTKVAGNLSPWKWKTAKPTPDAGAIKAAIATTPFGYCLNIPKVPGMSTV